jgi:hypothetical protein
MFPTLMLLVDSPAAVSIISSTSVLPRPSTIVIHGCSTAVLLLLRACMMSKEKRVELACSFFSWLLSIVGERPLTVRAVFRGGVFGTLQHGFPGYVMNINNRQFYITHGKQHQI